MAYRGFLLDSTYRLEGGRPVVHLYGKLDTGEPFLVRDDRDSPAFYIEAADAPRAAALGIASQPSDQHTLAGQPTARIDVRTPPDTPALRDRLLDAGIPCFEADLRYAVRYLVKRGIRGEVMLTGDSRLEAGLGRVFDNPEIAPAPEDDAPLPELAVLSFDIETDPRAQQVLSIALEGAGASEVLLWTPEGLDCPPSATPLPTQKALLEAFVERLAAIDPDVLTGWNILEFDLPVLARLAEEHRVVFALGRGGAPLRLRPQRAGGTQASLPGRLVLDGIRLLRGAFLKMESYALDAVAREVLGEGKLISGKHRAEEILRLFREDREGLVAYNRVDARLVLDILAKLKLVELSCQRSRLTGLSPDRVSGSIAAFDMLYLSELKRRRIVAPTVARPRSAAWGEGAGAASSAEVNYGGAVLEPEPGLWPQVLVFDFKSLYPSIIRTFQIDPLGYHRAAHDDDPIRAPNGALFRRQPGILPRLLDGLFPRREAAKAAGDDVASFAIKILMNSFYGVLGTSACRFHSPPVAGAITAFGRDILIWSKECIEGYGYRVLYGDTDSLFVASGADDAATARALGSELVARLNRDLAEHIANTWRVESRLELELERLYLKLLLAPVRQGTGGARKRYAGLVDHRDGPKVSFTGLEAVRRDWTDLARAVQRELYERLFFERPVEDYLERTVAELRAGAFDDRLVYRKALRKKPEEYTATTPPHVAAARKLPGKAPRVIRYLITPGGPEPAGHWDGPLDYEHYVDKQIRPVAEPVLAILGLDFAKVIGDDRQMSLF